MIHVSKCTLAGLATLVITLGCFTVGSAGALGEGTTKTVAKPGATVTAVEGTVVKRGAEIGDSPNVVMADVVEAPDKFADKSVVFEGTIAEVCQKKGCWMEVHPMGSETGVRVTFKDYGFFVPMDSHGMLVRAEGTFHTKVWSKEDADHLEGEGAKLVRNADGTATEIGFIATGVELTKIPVVKTEDIPKKSQTGSGE